MLGQIVNPREGYLLRDRKVTDNKDNQHDNEGESAVGQDQLGPDMDLIVPYL